MKTNVLGAALTLVLAWLAVAADMARAGAFQTLGG